MRYPEHASLPRLKQGQKRSTVEFFISLLWGWPTTYPLQCSTATHQHDIIDQAAGLLHLMMSQRKVPKADVCPFVCPSHICHSWELQHICYTLEESRVRHHQAISGLSMGNHHKTPVWRTVRRGSMTGKTNISNKEQVWMGWIHLSLTPTNHLFWSCTLTHQHINLYWS